MGLTQRGNKWWMQFVHKGVRYRESTGTSDREQAAKVETERRAQLNADDRERAKWSRMLNCSQDALLHCNECGRLFDGAHPVTSPDGEKVFHSEECERQWASRQNPTPMFEGFAEDFRAEMRSVHAEKDKTVDYYDNGLNNLLKFQPFREARLDRIDEELIAKFVLWRKKATVGRSGRPIKIASVNRELEVLRRLLRVAAEWKKIQRVPAVHRQPGEEGRTATITHGEEQSYLAVAQQPLRDVATMIVDCGFRPEEVHECRWENVHFKPAGKALYGHVFVPKGKTPFAIRNVSMTQRVKFLLEARWREQNKPREGWVFPAPTIASGHVDTDSLRDMHAEALRESGVNHFVIYTLRHTALTRLAAAGADAFAIQKIAGHSSILISQRYVHLAGAGERVEDAFTRLEVYNARKNDELRKEQEEQAAGMIQ